MTKADFNQYGNNNTQIAKQININCTNSNNIIEHDDKTEALTIKYPKFRNIVFGLSIITFGLSIGFSYFFHMTLLWNFFPFIIMIWVFVEFYIYKTLYIFEDHFIYNNKKYEFNNIVKIRIINEIKKLKIEFHNNQTIEIFFPMFSKEIYKLVNYYNTFINQKITS